MANSLSNFVDNLTEGIYKIICKYRHNEKNVKLAESNTNTEAAFLNTQILKII